MFRALLNNSVKASLVFALMGSTSVLAQSGVWKLSESNGQVSIGRQGVTKIAISGQNLRAGDVIRTGVRSRAVVTRGDQYMVVAANSHIKLANPETDGVLTQVFNYLGNVLFKVDKRKAKHFGVETPYMAAVVKGTTFNVSVGAQGSTVQVTEGAVEVSTLDGGAVELLRPGMIGMVAGADPFAMTIMGHGTRRIESPNRGVMVPKSSSLPTFGSKNSSSNISAQVAISRSITNQPVQLAALTNGLIEGQSPGSDDIHSGRQTADNSGQQNFLLATEDVVTNSGSDTEVLTLKDPDHVIWRRNGDGNNGGGNDPGGQDPSNPGQGNGNGNGGGNNAEDPADPGQGNGNGNGNGGGNGNSGKDGDGNNGGGNDPGGQDPSNPGQGNGDGNGGGNNAEDPADPGQGNGNGNGNGGGNGNSGKDGDGNNGGGNDPGGQDPSNPGQGNGNGNGGGNNAEDPADPGQGNGNGNGNGGGNGNGKRRWQWQR